MVFAKNVEVDPSLSDIKSGKVTRPEEIRISTQVSGLFGSMTNATVWTTQYDHEEKTFREDIVFQEGWLITGKKKERVMPWHLAMSHIRTITQVGGLLFKRKKYTNHRLYGSRDSYRTSVYEVVAEDPQGKVHTAVLGDGQDASLWQVLSRTIQNIELGTPTVTEMRANVARDKHHPDLSLAKTIDLARENSLRLRYNLFRVVDDIVRGDRYRAHFESLDRKLLDAVKEWTEVVWEDFSDSSVPKVWE